MASLLAGVGQLSRLAKLCTQPTLSEHWMQPAWNCSDKVLMPGAVLSSVRDDRSAGGQFPRLFLTARSHPGCHGCGQAGLCRYRREPGQSKINSAAVVGRAWCCSVRPCFFHRYITLISYCLLSLYYSLYYYCLCVNTHSGLCVNTHSGLCVLLSFYSCHIQCRWHWCQKAGIKRPTPLLTAVQTVLDEGMVKPPDEFFHLIHWQEGHLVDKSCASYS